MKEGQVVEVWAEAGKRGLSAPQLALLLGLSPPGPAHSTVVGSSNKRHQEAPWVLLTLPTFTGCFHPVLMVLAVGRREGEQLSPITVAPVRLAQFLSQTYPGLYVRDMIFRLGEVSNESVLHIRWPRYWSFSFSISSSSEYSGLISFTMH